MNDPMRGRIRELLRVDSEAETSTKRLLAIVGVGAALLLLTLWLFSGGVTRHWNGMSH
ncbi:MAG: hypothetical protein HKN78_03180 [Sphingomonadaceae bacterium]|nr:hypothetical protein [Sphingomonadaceae bacterium]